MFNFFEKADPTLQQEVENELMWDASITSTHVNVAVKSGVVTLAGTVPYFGERAAAVKAAQRVVGVRAVADEIVVKVMGAHERADSDIAASALTALQWNYQVPKDVKVVVDKGWVTLSGQVDWDYQRTAAKDSVSMLLGVSGVTNDVAIRTKAQEADVKTLIEAALRRFADRDAHNIKVSLEGDRVTLSGKVHSLAEIEDARFAAWNAPGVKSVVNNLVVTVW